jgi:hypothetical protein
MSGKPNLLGRPESQITGKLELPENWNYRKAGMTGKLIRLERWNDRKAGKTGRNNCL